jgi:DNA-binding MarR family transcriptional regulator
MPEQQPIGYLLTRLDQLINARFAAAFDASGVTRRQWQLMNVLERGAATTEQLDTAVAPFLDQGPGDRVSEHLGSLERRGWVVFAGQQFALTEDGRSEMRVLRDRVQDIRSALVERLADGEYERTVRNLATMIDNLEPATVESELRRLRT